MSLKAGIVGLPNVGKSTLFKALTRKAVDISNYPFCTIEPNVGIVEVPDERLQQLAVMSHSKKIVPAVVEFVDIAGLVKGASTGEGLGNKFLANIRETDAIVQVVRVFENPTITHVHNTIDPNNDIEVINTELILADLETIAKRKVKSLKESRAGNKAGLVEVAVLERLETELGNGHLVNEVHFGEMDDITKQLFRELSLLTMKPFLYVYNVSDVEMALPVALVERPHIKLDIKMEEELIEMTDEEQAELGVSSQIQSLITEVYSLLGLMTFLTTGEDESRAWTVKQGATAPQAGAAIHTDFETKFIRAEIIHWQKLLEAGSWSKARELGWLRLEGREAVVADGDVIVFKV
ncbi:MAG: redox-regulated ATPase YchF [Candidatus Moraniibacteriota bacterium]